MISPSPGATGVSDNLSNIIFSEGGADPLTLSGGGQTIPLTLEPDATPTPAGSQLSAALSAPLLPSTTYTVKMTFAAGPCSSGGTQTLGSFTTQ
jgi:hypothetical protein